jgi:uncharacterized protein YcfJ
MKSTIIALLVLASFGMVTEEVNAYVSQGCFGPIGQNYSRPMYYPQQTNTQNFRPTYRPNFSPGFNNNTYVSNQNSTYQARPYVGGENSTLIGALLGGVGGYALGHNSKNRGWITAGGALLGGIIGKQIDRSDDVMPSYYASTSYENRYYSSDRSSGKFDTGFGSGRVRAVPYGRSSGAMAE